MNDALYKKSGLPASFNNQRNPAPARFLRFSGQGKASLLLSSLREED